jgi:hypothetical protein
LQSENSQLKQPQSSFVAIAALFWAFLLPSPHRMEHLMKNVRHDAAILGLPTQFWITVTALDFAPEAPLQMSSFTNLNHHAKTK